MEKGNTKITEEKLYSKGFKFHNDSQLSSYMFQSSTRYIKSIKKIGLF